MCIDKISMNILLDTYGGMLMGDKWINMTSVDIAGIVLGNDIAPGIIGTNPPVKIK